MPLLDIGANLTHEAFAHDLDAVLQRARECGVGRMLVTGASRAGSVAALALARAHPGVLYATAGVHPHEASVYDDATEATLRKLARDPQARADRGPGDQVAQVLRRDDVEELAAGRQTEPVDLDQQLARDPQVLAIGETGLDYNRDHSPRDLQRQVFERQLALAAELGMPLFLHQRDAHADFLALIRRYRDRVPAMVVHCFTDSAEALRDYLALDCHIGITGWICDERRGVHLRELVREIPANRLMLETDAPYLLPRDIRPQPRHRRNEPMYLAHICAQVARDRGEPAEVTAANSTATAVAFFNLAAS